MIARPVVAGTVAGYTVAQCVMLKTHVSVLLSRAVQAREMQQQEHEAEKSQLEVAVYTALAQQQAQYEQVRKRPPWHG